jgi:zinc transport system substrate-binding protein
MRLILVSPRRSTPVIVPFLASLAIAALLGGCAAPSETEKPNATAVLAAFYPLEFTAARVAGSHADVRSLTPPGAEPHDLELSPAQVAAIGDAAVVVTIGGFQPAVDQALAARPGARTVDAATLTTLLTPAADTTDTPADDGGQATPTDPHLWLDPTRLVPLAEAIAAALADADPAHAEDFAANAAALGTELTALDADLSAKLADCERDTLVATHAAFGYFAHRYGLKQLAVGGIDPDAEPSPARLRHVADQLRGTGVTTVFFESPASPDIARTLAAELGVGAAVLTPLETAPDDGDYLTALAADGDTVATALGCR